MPATDMYPSAGTTTFGQSDSASIKEGTPNDWLKLAQEYERDMLMNITCMCLVVITLTLCQFTPKSRLSDFSARKLTHMSMGSLLLLLKQEDHWYVTAFVLATALIAILSCIFKPFRFASHYDKGVIAYNILAGGWVLSGFPLRALAPMFYADPLGAIVGRMVKSPRWIRNKTVAGSLAVFLATFLSAHTVAFSHRLLLACCCTLLEGLGGDYDNVTMSCALVAYFAFFQYPQLRDSGVAGGPDYGKGVAFEDL